MSKERGLALPFVLLVMTLLLVAVSAVAHQGLGTLQQAKIEEFRRQAVYAAEAGVADTIEQMVNDASLNGALPEVEMDVGAKYQVTIYSNFAGGGTQYAPNGAEIRDGYAYIYSVGTVGTITRRVGVLVTAGSASALGIAIGVGGNVNMGGGKRITGTVKASGDIDFGGSTRIEPLDGSGRVLASGSIKPGPLRVDDTQDVLARNGISGSVSGGNEVNGNDSSPATEPFINDGRFVNQTMPGDAAGAVVLPNPDPAVILADPNTVVRDLDPLIQDPLQLPYPEAGVLSLGGKTYYYPDGIDLGSVSQIQGPGTIVVANGRPIDCGNKQVSGANLVAIGGPDYDLDTSDITYKSSKQFDGLMYAHDNITTQGAFRLNGLIISYYGNFKSQGGTRVTLDATVLADIPGFGPWANGFGGSGGIPAGSTSIGVISWERL